MLKPHVTETPLVPTPCLGAPKVEGAAGTGPEPTLAAPPPTVDPEFGEHGTTTSDTTGSW